jgi:hypothetical protein
MYYREYVFMPPVDFTNSLLEISELSTIADIWERWNAIACFIIPSDYDMRNAAESVILYDDDFLSRNGNIEYIKYRMRYLSDRPDPARVYNLDMAIRFALGLSFRV